MADIFSFPWGAFFGLGIPNQPIQNDQGQTVFPTNALERALMGSDQVAKEYAANFMGPGGAKNMGYAGKFHGVVPEIKELPANLLKPSYQYERNGAISSMEKSGLTPEEWAKNMDFSEPVKASLYSDGSIKVTDGHHRQLAGEILGKNVPVELQAINAKADDINNLIWLTHK